MLGCACTEVCLAVCAALGIMQLLPQRFIELAPHKCVIFSPLGKGENCVVEAEAFDASRSFISQQAEPTEPSIED